MGAGLKENLGKILETYWKNNAIVISENLMEKMVVIEGLMMLRCYGCRLCFFHVKELYQSAGFDVVFFRFFLVRQLEASRKFLVKWLPLLGSP